MNDRQYIGGSDAAAVLGVSPWLSRLGLWERLMGMVEPEPPSERMEWGNLLEPVVRAEYERRTGRTVELVDLIVGTRPWMQGHPDGYIFDDENVPEGILEVKTAHHLSDEWQAPDTIPAHYFAQVQHYMAISGLPWTDVAVLVGGQELRIFTVPADREFQEALIEQEGELWAAYERGEPPEPDGSEDARRALRRLYPQATDNAIGTDLDSEFDGCLLLDLKQQIKNLEAEEEATTQRLMAYMGEAERMDGDGFTARWSNVAGRTDWKLVAGAYRAIIEGSLPTEQSPDMLDALVSLHTAPQGRRFSIKGVAHD